MRWVITSHSGFKHRKAVDKNAAWEPGPFKNLSRLLQAEIVPVTSPVLDDLSKYNAVWIISIWIWDLHDEISLARRARKEGKKVVVVFSHDGRFAGGYSLVNEYGETYTDLVDAADLCISGVPDQLNIYGRYKHKIISNGCLAERVNLSRKNKEKPTGILVTGPRNEHYSFGMTSELLAYLAEEFPNNKVTYRAREKVPGPISMIESRYKDTVDISYGSLDEVMNKAWVHVNIDWRPSPGRTVLESFYYRVPVISNSQLYYSKLYPDLTYNYIGNMDWIVDLCAKVLKTGRAFYNRKAELIAEDEYFEKLYKEIVKRIS